MRDIFKLRLEKAIHLTVRWLFSAAARIISMIFPRRKWYALALRLSYVQASLVRPFVKGIHRHTLTSRILNLWLGAFTGTGKPFPIRCESLVKKLFMRRQVIRAELFIVLRICLWFGCSPARW